MSNERKDKRVAQKKTEASLIKANELAIYKTNLTLPSVKESLNNKSKLCHLDYLLLFGAITKSNKIDRL